MTTPPARPPAFITAPPTRVLFLCVHNSARSQMAEGFARAVAPEGTTVWSAGISAGALHLMAVEVMREAGIDITSQQAKSIDDVPWREADTVVTLCGEADEVCPAVAAGVRRVHWPLPDPAKAPASDALGVFRNTRDEIRWRVSSLWPRGE
jgi:thioredoxin type arsenate reductase